MDKNNLRKILKKVEEKKIDINEAIKLLQHLPYDDLEYAKIDTHRQIRKDFPEAIFCAGKTQEQIEGIIERMIKHSINVLATKAEEKVYRSVKKKFPKAKYNPLGKIITVIKKKPRARKGLIAVVTAGTSDIPIAEEAKETLSFIGYKPDLIYDVGVAGIHRLFKNKEVLFKAKVIIVVAGMDGALPSVIAGLVDKPVIAVPSNIGYGASFKGLAALLSMLNSCAPGVAVVNIDNGFGAAQLASVIMQVK